MKATAFSPHSEIYIHHLKTDRKHNMSVQHYHEGYEIYFQSDGKRYLFYDNICYTLERGSLAIFKPFDIHYAESRESDYYERYVLNFRADMMSDILNETEIHMLTDKLHGCVIQLSEEQTNELCADFRRVEKCFARKDFFAKKLTSAAALELIVKVAEYSDANAELTGNRVSADIISAMRYIDEHYTENISLDDVARTVHISKFHFCRRFHDTTGATVLGYLNNVRLTKVHNLLLNTDMSIDEIASATGFSSAVNLTRAFKKVYQSAPREFRRLKKRQ